MRGFESRRFSVDLQLYQYPLAPHVAKGVLSVLSAKSTQTGDTMAEQKYDCAETKCSASGMTAAELAEHAVSAHSDNPTEVKLVGDPNTRTRLFGRKPQK